MLFTSQPVKQRDRRIVTFSRSDSFEADQFRRLRLRIEDRATTTPFQVIAVTSAASGEGKTLTAINLAGALAKGRDTRVLLIDADLRRPGVARACGLAEDGRGLISRLQGARDLKASVVRVDDAALDVLPCERVRVDPYEALRSPAFADLLAEARRTYQFIVVDTAPIVPVPDAGLISALVDGYLVVIAAGSTPRRLVAEALSTLAPQSVIGLVFNRDPEPMFGYFNTYGRPYFSAQPHEFEAADAGRGSASPQ